MTTLRDDIIRMAEEAGLAHFYDSEGHCTGITDARLVTENKERNDARLVEMLAPFAALIAAAEREACADKTGEFARKWWSIHCASNKHLETTRKAHDDFCALQSAIRARSNP